MGHNATADSVALPTKATPRMTQDALSAAALGRHAEDDERVEPVRGSEVDPLIRRNQTLGLRMKTVYSKEGLITSYRGQSKDLRQIDELAAHGSYRFSDAKIS